MLKNKKYLIIIPARKNSKRLPDKNLKLIKNKTLVERAIEFGLKIGKKKNIFLSTDSIKIKEIAQKYKIICPSLRSRKLSSDKATTAEVCIDVIKKYEKITNNKIQFVILLQPTSPFRSVGIFKKSLKLFLKNQKPTFTVSEFINLQFKHLVIQKKNKTLKITKDIPNYFFTNGNIYIISRFDLIKYKSFFKKTFNQVLIKSKKYSIDIDKFHELKFARKIG